MALSTVRTALTWTLALALLPGCSTAYYGVMEQFGVQKRHILVDRVEDGQQAQEDAQKQFQATYKTLREVGGVGDDELEPFYERMSEEFAACEAQAQEVRGQIDSIESVASDLFDEWSGELEQISSRDLRRQSERSLRDSQRNYRKMLKAMQKAESKMEPVLVAFRDQVLFMKHNLNARAIASLQGTVLEIETEVDNLIAEMEAAIREADRFLATMRG